MGKTAEAIPTPRPPTIRNTLNSKMLVGKAVPRAEAANKIPVRVSALFRPSRSPIAPPIRGPRMHPIAELLTAKPSWVGFRLKAVFRKMMAPEIITRE
jgi:hypothetical protein